MGNRQKEMIFGAKVLALTESPQILGVFVDAGMNGLDLLQAGRTYSSGDQLRNS